MKTHVTEDIHCAAVKFRRFDITVELTPKEIAALGRPPWADLDTKFVLKCLVNHAVQNTIAAGKKEQKEQQ